MPRKAKTSRMYWTARMVRWGRGDRRQLALVSPFLAMPILFPRTTFALAYKYLANSKYWTRPIRIPMSDIRSDTIPLEKKYKDALETAPVTASWFWERD